MHISRVRMRMILSRADAYTKGEEVVRMNVYLHVCMRVYVQLQITRWCAATVSRPPLYRVMSLLGKAICL